MIKMFYVLKVFPVIFPFSKFSIFYRFFTNFPDIGNNFPVFLDFFEFSGIFKSRNSILLAHVHMDGEMASPMQGAKALCHVTLSQCIHGSIKREY